MEPIRYELAGHIGVNRIPTDRFKTECISVNFLLPLTRENAVRAALLRSVLLRGTEGYPTFEKLSARLEELYGADVTVETRPYGEMLALVFTAEHLSNRYTEGTDVRHGTLDVLRQLLFLPVTENGVFRADFMESEKRRLADEIAATINEKGRYATRRHTEEMFRGTPAAIPTLGYAEDIPAIDAEELFAFYRRTAAEAPAEVYLVGADGTVREVEALFAGVVRTALPLVAVKPRMPAPVPAERRVFETMAHLNQGNLLLGYRAGAVMATDRAYSAAMLANEILGGSPIAKLFLTVREKMNLCYTVASTYRGSLGAVQIYAGIAPETLGAACRAIREMLRLVQEGDFSEKELTVAKKSLGSGILSGSDSPRFLVSFALVRRVAGIDDTPEALVSRIAAVTAAEVAAAAARFTPDTLYFLSDDPKAGEVFHE